MNIFIGNTITDCIFGFDLTGITNNTLIYNTIKDCKTSISINFAGLKSPTECANVITKNNIIGGGVGVWLSQTPFVDMNYWSYYNGVDENRDGVSDTPHIGLDEDYGKCIDYTLLWLLSRFLAS